MDIDLDAFSRKLAWLILSEKSTERACSLCHFQPTLETCYFLLSHHFIGSHRRHRETVKENEITLAGGMLPQTWCTLPHSGCICHDFLSTVYLCLYLPKSDLLFHFKGCHLYKDFKDCFSSKQFHICSTQYSGCLTVRICTYVVLILCQALL